MMLAAYAMQSQSGGNMSSGRGLMIHSLIYGFNLYSEISRIRSQYSQNKFPVFYFSRAVGNCQLMIEFFFEVLNERDEPLVAAVELIKSLFQFREYQLLIREEKLTAYVDD